MAHNGGKLQQNRGFIQTGRDYPFINFLKTAQAWSLAGANGPVPPNELDGNGYPTVINSFTGGYVGIDTVFFIPTQTSRPGRYVVRWTGEGTVFCYGTVFSGSLTNVGTGGTGRAVITVTDDNNTTQPGSISMLIAIRARGTTDYIRDLAFIHEDDETAFNAGEVFSPGFKAKLLEGGFGVSRFLEWQSTNTTAVARVEHMTPVGHYTYNGWSNSAWWAGSTTNVGDAYSTASTPSGWTGLVDKTVVTVKFNAASTASAPTLSIGGSTAKPIITVRGFSSLSGNVLIAANQYALLIYDTALGAWVKYGGDSDLGGVNTLQGGVPLSLMVRLCNEVGMHPWFHVPTFALDPLTDYVTNLATYCRDNLASGLIPRFEPANEVWNSALNFYATKYGWAREKARGYGTTDHHEWYGRVLSKMGQAISAVYSNDRTRYQVICGVQTIWGSVTPSSHDPRLSSARLVAETGVSGDAAKFWTTHVACDGYWGLTLTTSAEQTYADEYVSATTARKAEILQTILAGSNNIYTAGGKYPNYTGWKAWAAGFGVNKMTQYEGGLGLDVSTGDANRDTLRLACKTSPGILQQTLRNYDAFIATGGEFPSVLAITGPGRTSGQASNIWSVLDPDLYATPEPPQWTAIKLFQAGKRRFKLT
jgi:hypothetical protein